MPEPNVFISYAHEDAAIARIVAAGLEHRGCKVWIDEGELKAGDSVIERIAGAVGETEFLVALISEASVESRWCRREVALALTGELEADSIPRVLPVRVGQVKMPQTLADKYWLRVDLDPPEGVVQKLYEDVLAHHRARAGAWPEHEEAEPDGSAFTVQSAPLGPTPPASRTRVSGSAHSVRAELIGHLREGDLIGAEELVRRERRLFVDAAREQIAAAEGDTPGPEIDIERFGELEIELSNTLGRRFGSLFPLVQYGSPDLVRDEIRTLAELAGSDWGLGGAGYSA